MRFLTFPTLRYFRHARKPTNKKPPSAVVNFDIFMISLFCFAMHGFSIWFAIHVFRFACLADCQNSVPCFIRHFFVQFALRFRKNRCRLNSPTVLELIRFFKFPFPILVDLNLVSSTLTHIQISSFDLIRLLICLPYVLFCLFMSFLQLLQDSRVSFCFVLHFFIFIFSFIPRPTLRM